MMLKKCLFSKEFIPHKCFKSQVFNALHIWVLSISYDNERDITAASF